MSTESDFAPSTQDIIHVFESTFLTEYNTRLVEGDNEPLYQPAHKTVSYHQVIFAHGYFASALHEIAHWLVAGEKRRQLVDYGYWYQPDGRTELQQIEFERVEILPQAIEWALAVSCGTKFEVSSDNLSGITIDRLAFKKQVHGQVLNLLKNGFSERTTLLLQACHQYFKTEKLSALNFDYQGMYELV